MRNIFETSYINEHIGLCIGMYYSKVQSGSQLIIYYLYNIQVLFYIFQCIFLDKIICYLVSTISICICFQLDDFSRTLLHHQSMYIQDELNLIHLPGLAHTLRLEAFLESAPWKYYHHQSLYLYRCILYTRPIVYR